MASSRLVFLLAFIVCSFNLVLSQNVPVFMWGDLEKATEKQSSLSVTPEDFEAIYKLQLAGDPLTVLFIEKHLSAEDFSRKDSAGKTSFPYLQANIGKSVYIPSAQYPYEVLKSVVDPDKIYRVEAAEKSVKFDLKGERFLLVTFSDAIEGESRSDTLSRHNTLMETIFNNLKANNERVIAIYTSELPLYMEHSIKRRQAEALEESLLKFNNLLLYMQNITLLDGGNDAGLGSLSAHDSKYNEGEKKIEATLTYSNFVLTMYFQAHAGYWYFKQVDIQDKLGGGTEPVNNLDVFAVEGFSYRCGQTVEFKGVNASKDYTLVLQDMQVQPFFGASSPSFGDAFYCVGFTSVPIWAGLFVTFLLLGITFYGIMMMMDIRTMDRFDDPKGKTITVSSLE